jgi:hypothetical protein
MDVVGRAFTGFVPPHDDRDGAAGGLGREEYFTTQDFNAARLTIDFWRTVYALTYEPVKKGDGTIPALTEPSVSEWVPQG